jgi:2-polyprenyl-3-methyl-5-hydroxy-6-metoxy-1,4-benzoquinol methylase
MKFQESLVKNSICNNVIRQIGKTRTNDVMGKIVPFLRKDEKILDLGAGLCLMLQWLKNNNYTVEGVDIHDISLYPYIRPKIYDGVTLPYKNKEFDTVLILAVLHHIQDQEHVIREAKRVSKRIIIMEDIYDNAIQKYLTFLMDSFTNLEFITHPHSNRTDRQWREEFKRLGLKVANVRYFRYWNIFQNALYIVE